MNIGNDLIEAYKGIYEDELEGMSDLLYVAWIKDKIANHSPKERLDVYLQWNGILGWTDRIWELSQGEL